MSVPEKRYFDEFTKNVYPRPVFDDTQAKSQVGRVRELAGRVPRIHDFQTLKNLIDGGLDFELDYLFFTQRAEKSHEVICTMPLVGVRLSEEFEPERCYAIANSLRKSYRPDAAHLYFCADRFFVEADRLQLVLPGFREVVPYESRAIRKISVSLKSLCGKLQEF